MTPRILRALDMLHGGPRRIDTFDDHARDGLIDAGMLDPPLVETDGPCAFLTPVGRQAYHAAMTALEARLGRFRARARIEK
jgi:hypothetical protein